MARTRLSSAGRRRRSRRATCTSCGRDVVEVILFLLSDGGSYVTGQSLNVSGGMEFD